MEKTATHHKEAFDLSTLVTLLSVSYRDSYRDSSLKVRRRYRKLIAMLEEARSAQSRSR